MQKINAFLSKPEEAKRSKQFKCRLDQVELIAQGIYDITGCEKVTNVAFFALLEDFITASTLILSCKVIGVEKALVAIYDTIDAVFLHTLNQKTPLKFGYRVNQVQQLQSTARSFVGNFIKSLRPLALVNSKEREQELLSQRIEAFK